MNAVLMGLVFLASIGLVAFDFNESATP